MLFAAAQKMKYLRIASGANVLLFSAVAPISFSSFAYLSFSPELLLQLSPFSCAPKTNFSQWVGCGRAQFRERNLHPCYYNYN